MTLRAPFPWFGGKSRAAHLVWPRFGDVANYIEPFAGSLAVLLARPDEYPPRVETVNDKDAYLANFWRAVQKDPDHVAFYADWPVNETDLHARHRWLVETARARVEQLTTNPEYFDAKIAGWWVYGQCLWIGSGWCSAPQWAGRVNAGRAARGVHTDRHHTRPDLTNVNGRGGVLTSTTPQRKRPALHAHGNRGVIEPPRPPSRRPNAGGRGGGQGVHAPRLTRQLPQLSGDGSGSARGLMSDGILDRSGGLYAYMNELATRLRRVRVCCGDWKRVLTPAVTTYIGTTGVLLDPPYAHAEREICYSHDEDISPAVRAWAIANGDDPKMRIAYCGYEGEAFPATWSVSAWKAGGGYGRTKRGKGNRHRERIWFSPHCLADNRHPLLMESAS